MQPLLQNINARLAGAAAPAAPLEPLESGRGAAGTPVGSPAGLARTAAGAGERLAAGGSGVPRLRASASLPNAD